MRRLLRMGLIALMGSLLVVGGVVLATDAGEKYVGRTEIAPGSPFCFEVGKDSELGGDCFCVKDDLTTVEELDCLVASGVVPENEYDSFLRGMGLLEPERLEPAIQESTSSPNSQSSPPAEDAGSSGNFVERPFCFAIGKESQLDNDCFCVEGELTTLAELDCLIASDAIPEAEYENYRQSIEATSKN